MDRTETYAKMSDCEEIQALRSKDNWQYGDYYATLFNDGIFLVYPLDAWADTPLYIRHRSECIWLPRQDQLQEMVLPRFKDNIWIMLSNFGRMHPMDNHGITSMEQLWLAFYMKEKHNKVWNGEEWVHG